MYGIDHGKIKIERIAEPKNKESVNKFTFLVIAEIFKKVEVHQVK